MRFVHIVPFLQSSSDTICFLVAVLLLLLLLLLQLLQGPFTASDSRLRKEAFAAWHAFIECCWQLQQLVRKRGVLTQPMRFALQHDASSAVKLAAVGSWGCLMQMLTGQHRSDRSSSSSSSSGAAAAGGDSVGLALCCVDVNASPTTGVAAAAAGGNIRPEERPAAAGAEAGLAAWLQGFVSSDGAVVDAAVKTLPKQQQQQQCEAVAALPLVFDVMVKPITEGIMGSSSDTGGSSSRKKSGSSSSSKPPKDSSCLAGLPVVQLVLQQLLQLAPAASAAASKQQQAAAAVTVKVEPGTAPSTPAAAAAGTSEAPVAVLVCRLLRDTICGSKPAAAVLAAAAAGLDAAAADQQSLSPSGAACKTPGPAAAGDSSEGKSNTCKCGRMSTPPPTPLLALTTPLGLAAAAADGTPPPVAPAFGMQRLSAVNYQALAAVQQQCLQPAAGFGDLAISADLTTSTVVVLAAPPGVQARPEWVLQTASGWLQLMTVCLKQLTQQQQQGQQWQQLQQFELGLSAEQLVLLQQEWLPAWEQLLMLIGAAIQLQQLQQQQQGKGSMQQHEQLLAVQAAVQAVHAVSSVFKVSVRTA
jgi:hypothetical protein